MEMGRVNGGATNAGYSQPPAREDPYAILNESQDINRGIDTISQNLRRLQSLQQQALDDPDASQNTRTNRELDALSSDTMTLYRSFAQRVTKLKQTPGAGNSQNSQQLGRVDRKLKEAIQEYQRVDAEFRKKLQEQMARQYRIVRPDASDSEVREAVSDTSSTQVFSQAVCFLVFFRWKCFVLHPIRSICSFLFSPALTRRPTGPIAVGAAGGAGPARGHSED